MVMPVIEVSYIGVLVAAVVSFAIGMAWYSPLLFGKAWMKLMGFTEGKVKEKKKGMGKTMAAGFAAVLVMSYVMAYIVGFSQAASVTEGAEAGFWVWLGFVATVMLGQVLWEGKPFKLYLINSLHYLVALVAMGIIHAAVF